MQPFNKIYSHTTSKILMFADTWNAKGQHILQASAAEPGLAVLENGRYILKEGTIWPANDATAEGVVLQDYDLTDNDQNVAIVFEGDIKTDALPATPSANAIAALPRITVHGAFTGYPVTFAVSGSNGTVAATVDGVAISTGAKVYPGKTVIFTATPASNYAVDSLTGNGEASGTGSVTYTLVIDERAEAVTVSFKSAT